MGPGNHFIIVWIMQQMYILIGFTLCIVHNIDILDQSKSMNRKVYASMLRDTTFPRSNI